VEVGAGEGAGEVTPDGGVTAVAVGAGESAGEATPDGGVTTIWARAVAVPIVARRLAPQPDENSVVTITETISTVKKNVLAFISALLS